ncbi:hypothetical protein RCH21_003258 [Arthrobacter sp. PL16]|jgi:hypothetical protein|uniref:hypothetical protein n=1 Tax=Arthrobacter sp. PL16 TaxID=3071720 RepID=UPI002E0AF8C2|nr:hypothetical protein [Arthrobacter sp. PL16]
MAYQKGADGVVIYHDGHRGVYNSKGELTAIGFDEYREIFFDPAGSGDVTMLFEREFDSEGNVLPEREQDWETTIGREAYSMLSEFFRKTSNME